MISQMFYKKKYKNANHNQDHGDVNHVEYNIFDLICVGVGATLGSGVFVLTGLVARDYAGPSSIFSWMIAGLACCFSAMSYAELSSRMPSAGSAYTFVYCTLGEWPAYIASWCLTLECGVSAAAVARNWGVKLSNFFLPLGAELTNDDFGLNIYSGLLMLSTVLLFLVGTEVSKLTINVFTVLKICLVFFMIFAGLSYFNIRNMDIFLPMGISGCMRGATSCFFGFVGYDEVCCMALETKDAKHTLPYAVFGTIGIVTFLYALSSFALTGMLDYRSIDQQSGFSDAFSQRGAIWASDITAVGELLTLPLVVIVSFLPQSRILYAMACDGLCPTLFSYRDKAGNFTYGIIYSGLLCILIALFIPFTALDDVISAGVLMSFNLVNNSLLLIRCNDLKDIPWRSPSNRKRKSRKSSSTDIKNSKRTDKASQEQIEMNLIRNSDVEIEIDADQPKQETAIVPKAGQTKSSSDKSSTTPYAGRWNVFAIVSRCAILLIFYNIQCVVISILLSLNTFNNTRLQHLQLITSVFGVILLFTIAYVIWRDCSAAELKNKSSGKSRGEEVFQVPFMPFSPLIGLFINYFLIVQLSIYTIFSLIVFFLVVTILYLVTKWCISPEDEDGQSVSPTLPSISNMLPSFANGKGEYKSISD
jgi:amino acid transporter